MERASRGTSPVLVVGIPGSLRDGGSVHRAVQIALAGARSVGAETRMLDLRDYSLPFCDGRDDESTYPPGVGRLRHDVGSAQGVILGTPEYHGSVSGVLKNALDLMGFDEMEGKMIGLVGTAGGSQGAQNALSALRDIGRSLHAWVLPQQASVSNADAAFHADGTIKDPKIEERLRRVGAEVARFAFLHSSSQAREFLTEWEKAATNPGGIGR
jgi:NAD(P)H-dependent FMN reductase